MSCDDRRQGPNQEALDPARCSVRRSELETPAQYKSDAELCSCSQSQRLTRTYVRAEPHFAASSSRGGSGTSHNMLVHYFCMIASGKI